MTASFRHTAALGSRYVPSPSRDRARPRLASRRSHRPRWHRRSPARRSHARKNTGAPKNYRANTVIVATQISQYLELQPAVISRVETGIGRCCNRNSKENLVVSQNKLTTNKYCKSGLEKRAAASRAEGPSSRARVPPMDYGDTRWLFDNAISIRPSDAAAGSDDGGSGTTSTGRKDGVPSPSSPGW